MTQHSHRTSQQLHAQLRVVAMEAYVMWDGWYGRIVDSQRVCCRLGEERARLEALGATFMREAEGMAGEIWIEMFDPEGNLFRSQ